MYPTSDLQFLAQMLLKSSPYDFSVSEKHRLEEIAENGVSNQPIPGEGGGAPILNTPPTHGSQV